MDAYDIFKKLTKGLKFKQPILGVKNNTNPQKDVLKKEEINIKQEPEDVDPPQSDIEPSDNESESEDQSDDKTQATDGQLQLLEGVKIGEKRKKKNKEKSEDLQKKLELEEQNRFRNEHGIKTVGRHVPSALQDFTDLKSRYNVSPELIDVVMKCGYSEPTPIQRQAMPCMLEDRQILACAPTGSGKTAAFLIPILHALGAPQGGPRALVLCPTRELAQQIFTEVLRLSASTQLRCSVIRNMKESKIKEREATIRKSDIVISTPNRLCYLLNRDTVNISLDKVKWLIIDEADKLFEGSVEEEGDFRQQLDVIMAACAGAGRRVAMFSATHTPSVAKWTRHHLRGLVNVTVGQRNAATHLVEQELLYCGNENGKMIAFRQLVQNGLKPPVLVFVQSKERAKQLFKELIYDGINVDVIHADRTQAQRDNVVRSFRVGRIWVLICTELMGRGIDFRGVNLVVNYDFPPSAISYIHRVGRAGRAGHKGRAVTFFTQDDVNNLRSIAAVMAQSGCAVPAYTLRMRQDRSKRRERVRRAVRREQISTILVKPEKRKLDASKEDQETAKATKIAKTGKHRNNVQNQDDGKSKGKNNKNKKLANNGNGVIKNKNKKLANKKIKKNLKNNVVNKKSKGK